MIGDSGGEWTEQVEADYKAFRKRLQLFRGGHKAYFVSDDGQKQLYPYRVHNWLGDRLSRRVAEMVFPGFPRLFASGPAQQALISEHVRGLRVPEITYPTALMVSWAGWAPWKLYWSQQRAGPALCLWGVQEGEFAVFDYRPGDRAAPYAVNCWYQTERKEREGERVRYRVNERYEHTPASGVVFSNRAWLVGDFGEQKEVHISEAWPRASQAPPEMGLWPTSELPVFSIPNVDLFGEGTGDTDYTESLVDLQKEVNAVAAQRALVVALTGLPHFNIPRRLVREDGTVDLRNIWLEVEYEGEEPTPIRIENWTGNLDLTRDQMLFLNDEFMRLTFLSPAVDGQTAGGGGESGYARRLSMVKLEAAVWRRRASYESAFEWLFRTAQELSNARGGGRRRKSEVDLSVLWPAPVPEDPETLGRLIQAARLVGTMSREAAVRRLNPTESDEWISKELERIEQEPVAASEVVGKQTVDTGRGEE